MLFSGFVQSVGELVMRDFNYCVIDEVDSILIDEARTPLIISGPAEKPSDRYYKAAKIAAAFERDIHYTVRILFVALSMKGSLPDRYDGPIISMLNVPCNE